MIFTYVDTQIIHICVWAALFIISIIIEIATVQLVSIWFAGASLITLLLSVFHVPLVIQIIVWFLTSAVLIIFCKVILGDKFTKNSIKTNYDAMIGEEILITKTISPKVVGEGRFRDVVWTCKSNVEIKEGSYATIVGIEGNKLIVENKGE